MGEERIAERQKRAKGHCARVQESRAIRSETGYPHVQQLELPILQSLSVILLMCLNLPTSLGSVLCLNLHFETVFAYLLQAVLHEHVLFFMLRVMFILCVWLQCK